MNELGNSTLLPLALWLKTPPKHNISCILYLEKSNSVITGCEHGQIIIWSYNKNGKELYPNYYLIGHESKITHFVLAGSSRNTNKDYFISFSVEREMGLWEAKEGRNIEFIPNSLGNITYLYSYESVNTKLRLIFCCQKNCEIIVLNSMSLAPVCILACTSSPNWFSSLTAFNKQSIGQHDDDVILATTVSGLISVWIVNFTDVLNQEKPPNLVIDAEKYFDISSTIDPFKITHNPKHSDIMLVITPSQFKIYHIKDWNLLSYQDCHRGDYFIDGDFISHHSIIIHTQSGKSFYFKLPPRADFENSLFMKSTSNICDNIPMLLLEFNEPENMTLIHHKVYTEINKDKFIIWKGYSNGHIYKWKFMCDKDEKYPVLFNLEKSWSSIKKKPASLSHSLKNSDSNGIVTSLLLINDLSVIVLGMESGLIFIRNINDVLNSAFSEHDINSEHYITLKGHTGPVTCLVHPSSNMKLPNLIKSETNCRLSSLNLLKLAHILWSGGVDYTIRIWNIKSEQMLNIYHCHSAPLLSLRLSYLPLNSDNVYGISQGFTEAMFNSIDEEENNSYDIKQMINICMNAFLVGIAEDDGISIISIMKQKLLLYTAEHKSPVRCLGWAIESGYLLLDTIENRVFVWDLSSGILDRIETGAVAQMLMDNCKLKTKIRSKLSYMNGSKSVRRHGLDSVYMSDSSYNLISNNKLIRFQFIDGGDIYRSIPIIIFNLSALLDSLSNYSQISSSFCDILLELDNQYALSMLSKTSVDSCNKSEMDLDILLRNAKSDKQNLNLKILLIKIILSQCDPLKNNSTINTPMPNIADISCSQGQSNSKTGCIIFNLKSLFEDSSQEPVNQMENLLIQLSISNKIISLSKSALFDTFLDIYSEHGNDYGFTDLLTCSVNLDTSLNQKSSTITVKSFKNHRKKILNKLILEFLKALNGEINDISFNFLERIFNRLIFGILDLCDTISKSALQLLAKIISNLTDQQIQNYILVWRLFLSPKLDIYGSEDSRTFLLMIQPFFDTFIEYSYLSSDWIWWFEKNQIKGTHEKRNLSKIQIKALLNIALVGSHLLPDDVDKISDDVQLFSKLFSLDKSFLARITCDFLMTVLSMQPRNSKSNIGRLINLAMMCLSNGFSVWEPYLDSNSVICQFLKLAIDLEDPTIDDKFLSLVSRKAIEDIASVRPALFIMVCYREMLKNQNNGYQTAFQNNRSIDRRKSTPSLSQMVDKELMKADKLVCLLNRNILVPIFNDLCKNQSEIILDVLPELVELYVYFYIKEEDFSSFMLPVLKFSSVSLNNNFGQISVGSVNGYLILFDLKIGKYFSVAAHKKSIRITKLSDDAKFVASYSLHENLIKIWQISNHHLFNIGNNSYQVKNVSSHAVPTINNMMATINLSPKHIKVDHLLEKYEDVYLEWDTDNKSLFIKLNGQLLRQIKL